jgi:hypothetical protein
MVSRFMSASEQYSTVTEARNRQASKQASHKIPGRAAVVLVLTTRQQTSFVRAWSIIEFTIGGVE